MPTPGVGSMSKSEVIDFIKKSKAGVLCLIDEDRPYAVPLEHFYHNNCLYFAVSAREDSRKLRCIRKNNRACYVIYESRREKPEMVKEGRMCRSIIVEGKIIPVAVKEIDVGNRKVKLQILKLEMEKIGNWVCPLEECDMRPHILERRPDLLKP